MGRSWLLMLVTACSFKAAQQRFDASGHDDGSVIGDGSPDAAIDAPPTPTVTFVRSASAFSSPWNASASSVGVTFDIDAGDTIAVWFTYDDHASLQSVDDDQGDTFTIVDTTKDTDANQGSTTAYATNAHGGTTHVTAHLSQSICCRIAIGEDLHGASALDAHSGRFQSSVAKVTDGVTANPITTTAPGELVFAATTDGTAASGQTFTAGGTATRRENVSNGTDNGNAAASEDQPQAQPGQVTPTFTPSKSGSAVTMVMAFEP